MRNILRSLVVAIIILILITYSNISVAVQSMQDLQNEQDKVNDEISDAKDKLEEVIDERSKTLKQVEKLITEISAYTSDINDLKDQISDLQKEIDQTEKEIKEDEIEYKKEDEAMQARLVTMYKQGDTSYLDYMFASANIVDFISSYYLVSQIAEYDVEMLEKIQAHKEKIEQQKAKLEESKKSLDSSKKTLETKQNALKVVKQDKEKYATKLSKEEKDLAKEIEELKSYESSISKKIQKMKEEYDRQHANSGGIVNNGSSSYGFGWPVTNHGIGTRYGVSGRYWSLGYHTGVDFPVPRGTSVYAVGNGQVFDTGYSSAYGNYVEIYHGNNIYSFYAHGSSVNVREGQTVSKGQKIMSSGATGNVTGPHLHFEIRTPGYGFYNCVNPMNYLPH